MLRRLSMLLFVIAGASRGTTAQCLDWHTFPLENQTSVWGTTACVYDDGTGSALYVGFKSNGGDYGPDPAGFQGIQRWNGSAFAPVGSGFSGRVNALVVFDDGSGPALFVAGEFTIAGLSGANVAKWNGTTWQMLDTGQYGQMKALAVHDDGTGPALYAAGRYFFGGCCPVPAVVKWTGSGWINAGGFWNQFSVFSSLASYDDGSGPALYAGGFLTPGLTSTDYAVAKLSGGAWTGLLPGSYSYRAASLCVFDDGSGPALYAGGNFPPSPTTHGIQRWNGTSWSAVGSGIPSAVASLDVLDEGGVSRLYAGVVGSPSGSWRWDGATWTAYESAHSQTCSSSPSVNANVIFDEGTGPHLLAVTNPGSFGSMWQTLSRWSGTAWEPTAPTTRGFGGNRVRALVVHDDGSGPAIYAGGNFCGADDVPANNIARWDGSRWTVVGNDRPQGWIINAMETYDDGSGPALFEVGEACVLWKWDGFAWTTPGGIPIQAMGNEVVLALKKFGPDLYLGGGFVNWAFTVQCPNIVRWNGSSFLPVASGLQGSVNALEVFDAGSGPALYAAGSFLSGSGVSMSHVGRFDGTSWTPLGSGTNAVADAFAVFDDGTGPALYVGGAFTTAGGIPASCVARWNGSNWSALGAGLDAQVLSLGVFDDGSGPALYAGGNFTASGATPMSQIARWNGTSWSGLGGGVDGAVWSLQSHDDGTGVGPQLFVAGDFARAGNLPSKTVAAWHGCGESISKFCFGDDTVSACPCFNAGLPGRGCNNSQATGGARLNASGTTSPDAIQLYAAGELQNAATLVFQGDALLTSPSTFGDGLRCCGGHIRRMYAVTAVNGTIAVPSAAQPSISAKSALLGDPLLPGAVRCYQTWYRDPNLGFCSPPEGNAWNLSNAVRIAW